MKSGGGYRVCDAGYWDGFYGGNDGEGQRPYEWYLGAEDLVGRLDPMVAQAIRELGGATGKAEICEIGAGNSLVLEHLLCGAPELLEKAVFTKVEIADAPIEQLRLLQEVVSAASPTSTGVHTPFLASLHKSGLLAQPAFRKAVAAIRLVQHDATHLDQLFSASLAFVLDKGCLDAMLSTGLSEHGDNPAILRLLQALWNALKPRASVLVVSRNAPFLIEPYIYQHGGFDISDISLAKSAANGGSAYLYTWTKTDIPADD
eukprot:ANDGO_01898.mRNA.1 methyltransferase domain containing protein